MEYNVKLDEDYLVTLVARTRKQARSHYWFAPLKLFSVLGVGAFFALSLYHLIVPLVIIFGFLLVLLAIGPRFDYWRVKRSFRRSHFYNCTVHFLIESEGIVSSHEHGRSENKWSTYTKALRFSDGFLIFSSESPDYWWPDSALISGNISDVESVLKEKILAYRCM